MVSVAVSPLSPQYSISAPVNKGKPESLKMPRRRLGHHETEVPKWSLVLFDWDGYTACVESRRFTDQPCVKIGSRTQLSYDGQLHLVEILALEKSLFN
uniref:Uncharacterized protein n=1 Tax=Magallana gigas TaxID=29159 RepID=A0A8W8MPI4_MAGGI